MGSNAEQQPDHPNCLNCGAELHGQYCGHCGQRARSRLISLWELLQDAFGDLFEIDSRLWRTLIPLLIRPGRLTRDYLEGRRARYMPPFRMYLVLSVIFFVVAFFDPQDDLSLLFEPEPEAQEVLDELADELAEEGIVTPAQTDQAKDWKFTVFDAGKGGAVNFDVNEESGTCSLDMERFDLMPEWLKKRLTPERLVAMCERFQNEGAKVLLDPLVDNIPIALIVLLPFMALVLKGLYPLSRRYFVEHLLFFLHFHAFFFLILTLQILFSRLAGLIRLPEAISILVLVAASFYILVYLYKAMRHVYGQGRLMTITKYIALSVAYWIGASFTMVGALLFALLSV